MTLSASLFPPGFRLASPMGIALFVATLCGLGLFYLVIQAIYNIYFHPLSHIPGPKLAAATWIPYTRHQLNGSLVTWLKTLHARYGEVVRVSPTELSFISGETAWQDIYGFRTGKNKTPPYLKDRTWFPAAGNGVYPIISADEATHSRVRRTLAHAFSDKALREQEGTIQSFVNLLVHRLGEQIEQSTPIVDLSRWYNYTTFDVISDLTFGEPTYCLRDNQYHAWVSLVFAAAKGVGIQACIRRYPILQKISQRFVPRDAVAKRAQFFSHVQQRTRDRITKNMGRPDFVSHILKNVEVGDELVEREIESNASIFMLAGTETTATSLAGVTYLLLKHPYALARIVEEVRGKFKTQDEITVEKVTQCEYLVACLKESMRLYPPVATGFPRVVPKGGDTISGYYVPEGTSVYISQHAANHSPRNFIDPEAFIPERWLGTDPRFANDKREVAQPFSFGPRNCLGKNLANAEMRLIMANVLYKFDLELVDHESDWLDQKLFTLWDKGPLMVRLRFAEK